MRKLSIALGFMLGIVSADNIAAPRAEVMHWWTSGGESAALKIIADRYRAAGGVWIDTAISDNGQERALAVRRIIGGNPPTSALFNTSKQYLDLIEEDMLSNVDEVARKGNWDSTLPEPVRSTIKVGGHYYAVPLSLHIVNWFWYSKAAFKKAGIHKEPASLKELFAALDKLKAAGLVPLAHGGQPWEENVLFMAMLAEVGGTDLYLKIFRDRDPQTILSARFGEVLHAFKRLHGYLDAASPGRSWNDSTALVLSGRAGMQIMGDWVKGEVIAAGMQPGAEIGCLPGLGTGTPLVVAGDAFIFPKSANKDVQKAQKLLAEIMVAPATQLAFSRVKGSSPLGVSEVDPATLDMCTRKAVGFMQDSSHQVGYGETYLTAGQNGALVEVLEKFWRTNMSVGEAQRRIARALR